MWPTRALHTLKRVYLYDLDVHGQLFLSSAKLRTLATAYRDPRFLATFYARLRRNEGTGDEAKELRKEGYEWISLCEGEENFLRPAEDGSALVYQDLQGQELVYAGGLTSPFDPSSLRVDPSTGYLFHPSPIPRRARDGKSPYGPYSLLRSSLVLERFSHSLDLDEKGGGSFEFDGRRYEIGTLRSGDVWKRQDC
ncbi:hypothetical protein JCM10207_002370 [Rhodosporidiobolus poonsookiae]